MTIRIYSMDGQKVYEVTEEKMCPGSYSFTWDGTVNVGYGYFPPEGGSDVAPEGLYTFDVFAEFNPYDSSRLRSVALTVERGPVEYYGYDDGGTPEDETDDSHLYYIRWYALYSGRNSSWGEIWLYDPDFVKVSAWAVPMLNCVVHGGNDGLVANPNGEIHSVIIPVPVSAMEKVGTYRFVLHFYDDYSDSYKNHQVKAALEVNSLSHPLEFTVSTDPVGDSQEGHPGYWIGARDAMKFYVIIKASLFLPGEAPPPFRKVMFLLIREKTGERGIKTGFLVTDPKDPDGPKPYGNGYIWTYRTEHKVTDGVVQYTHWVVTEKKGRWTILIPPHRSNEVTFKINKRKQIVLVAESWVGATSAQLGGLCRTLASKVYTHVGFPLPASSSQYYLTIPEPTLMNGCLIFYTFTQFPDTSHVAIQVDTGFVVDINCAYPANQDIHPDTLIVWRHALPRGYAASARKSPLELISLDGE